MSSLRDELATLRSQISTATATASAREVYGEMESIKRAMEPWISGIRNGIGTLVLLEELGDCQLESVQKLSPSNAIESLGACKSYWSNLPDTLKQSDEFSRFLSAAKSLSNTLNKINQDAWTSWVNAKKQLYVGEGVLNMARRGTQQDRENARTYENLWSAFEKLTAMPPCDTVTVAKLLNTCSEMSAVAVTLKQVDIPTEVSSFLDQVDHPFKPGVPLSELTDTVLEWLRENEDLTSFLIKRRPR